MPAVQVTGHGIPIDIIIAARTHHGLPESPRRTEAQTLDRAAFSAKPLLKTRSLTRRAELPQHLLAWPRPPSRDIGSAPARRSKHIADAPAHAAGVRSLRKPPTSPSNSSKAPLRLSPGQDASRSKNPRRRSRRSRPSGSSQPPGAPSLPFEWPADEQLLASRAEPAIGGVVGTIMPLGPDEERVIGRQEYTHPDLAAQQEQISQSRAIAGTKQPTGRSRNPCWPCAYSRISRKQVTPWSFRWRR